MNRVVAFLFLVLPLLTLSQKDKSPKNGKAVFYYPSESKQKIVKSTGSNLKGLPNGEWQYFHANGKLDYTQEFLNGIPNGFRKTYLNDVLIYEEHFEDSLLNGQQNYYDEQSRHLARYFFNKGVMDSVHYFNADTRRPFVEKVYKGTALTIRREYFSSGELRTLLNTNSQKQFEGLQLEYQIDKESGKYFLSDKKNYLAGKLEGEYYEANVNGPLIHCYFKQSVYHGSYKDYYSNGQLKYEVNYIDGIKSGKGVHYYQNKRAHRIEFWSGKSDQWESPIFDSMYYYHEDGFLTMKTVVFSRENKMPEMKITNYYPGGSIESSYSVIDGSREGLSLNYYENGKLERQLNYLNNDIQGSAIFWYPDGKKKMELRIENNTVLKQKAWTKTGQAIAVKDKIYRDLFDGLELYYLNNPELDKFRPKSNSLFTEMISERGGNGTGSGRGFDSEIVEVIEEVPGQYDYKKRVRTEAKFPGKSHELEDFINRTKRVPQGEVSRQTWVVVKATFTVEADGTISNVSLTNNSGSLETFPIFSIETMRILSLMPNWIPATNYDGQNVSSTRKVNFYF